MLRPTFPLLFIDQGDYFVHSLIVDRGGYLLHSLLVDRGGYLLHSLVLLEAITFCLCCLSIKATISHSFIIGQGDHLPHSAASDHDGYFPHSPFLEQDDRSPVHGHTTSVRLLGVARMRRPLPLSGQLEDP